MNRILNRIVARFRIDPLGVCMPGPHLSQRIRQIVEAMPILRISRPRLLAVVLTFALVSGAFVATTLTRAQLTPPHDAQYANDALLPAFEAASVKPTPSDDHELGTFFTYPGGRIVARGCTLNYLITLAYNVQHFQISGGEPWTDDRNVRFSIDATPPADSASTKINPSNPKLPPPQEERLMLRALLADRFQLAVKQTTQDVSGFALVLKDRNPKLSAPKDAQAYPVVATFATSDTQTPLELHGINAPMAKFADRLSDGLSAPVVDRTGLHGSYDFVVKFAESTDENASAPLLKDAVGEIGLKLEPAKVPALHLEIERAARPAAN